MKQTIKFNLLPNHFSGFYESYLSNMIECAEEYALENMKEDLYEEGIKVNNVWDLWDYLNVDYAGAREYLSKSYIDCFIESVNDILDQSIVDISSMKFDHLWSPREYNFTTDKLYVTANVDECELLDYASNNLVSFIEYCKNNFTSCDGFTSFYSNDSRDWLNGSVKHKCEEIYFTYMIDFYITNTINTYTGPIRMYDHGSTNMDEFISDLYYELEDTNRCDGGIDYYISYDLDAVKLKHSETL